MCAYSDFGMGKVNDELALESYVDAGWSIPGVQKVTILVIGCAVFVVCLLFAGW